MDKQTFYLVKEKDLQVIGKQTKNHRFLFKGNGEVKDFRSWVSSIKQRQGQGYTLRSDLDLDEDLPLKIILDTILENAGKQIHSIATTSDGWADRLGNTFTNRKFK